MFYIQYLFILTFFVASFQVQMTDDNNSSRFGIYCATEKTTRHKQEQLQNNSHHFGKRSERFARSQPDLCTKRLRKFEQIRHLKEILGVNVDYIVSRFLMKC